MNLRLITASAGAGKTWRLTQELDEAIAAGRARPDKIVATTFTALAAAELMERARARLLQGGRGFEAHQLLTARIGTVNAVCGALVAEFAFDLGVSPSVQVLDDPAADLEFRRAVARVVGDDRANELDSFKAKFEPERNWESEVRAIVEGARANGLGVAHLAACASRSLDELDKCLGAVTSTDLDGVLRDAIVTAIIAIEANDDNSKGTAEYLHRLRGSAQDLASTRGLAWGSWASLARAAPTKRSLVHAIEIQQVSRRHVAHPRLRSDLHRLVTLQFDVAADSLAAYEEHKRVQGVMDFVDQETLALTLLRRADIRAALAGEIDLFLVDEFQDTSPIQLAVFLELAMLATESVWVGDPKQAIYGFRGTDPLLMDAAVESLASTLTDPELVERAAFTMGAGRVETLNISHRSRPALVAVTNEVFARAFGSQGMPEQRTRLVAKLQNDPPGFGEAIEYWPLELDRSTGSDNDVGRAAAVAAGVRDLLVRAPNIRAGDGVFPARRCDVAVLCRTNKQCQEVADALAALGVAAIVPRMGLLVTTEAQVARAGLALWVDPGDALAAAELARIITYPTDLDGFVACALATPGRDAFRSDLTVARIVRARALSRDLGPVAAVDAVIAATELRTLCAAWGDTAQRLANLDALRAHVAGFAGENAAASVAATVVGLLRYLDGLVPMFRGWRQTRTDRQALLTGDDAVTISTWHRAKGLEWPIAVLFGLESVRVPTPYGSHVMSDRAGFDVADPLGGRWIRCWPNPYTTGNQLGAVRDAFERTAAHATLVAKADREALRVLYVGWTRARDFLMLAAKRGHLLGGIVGKLAAIDPSLICEPPGATEGVVQVNWAGLDVSIRSRSSRPAPAVNVPMQPGLVTVGRSPEPRHPARSTPSSAAAVACELGEVVILGPRIGVNGKPDMEAIGRAIHGVLAADLPELGEVARLEVATDLLARYGVADHLVATEVVAAASRLWTWIDARFSCALVHREWPIVHCTEAGTIVAGAADLVLGVATGFVVIDHKTFPGTAETAAARALGYSGQLAAYADAIRAATGVAIASTWIHFPVRGRLVEVRLLTPKGE